MLAPMLTVFVLHATPAFWVTNAPRHAHLLQPVALLTEEQVQSAPVEALTLKQLYAESARLDSPPSIVPPVVMLGVGGGISLVGGVLSYLCILATQRSSGWATLGWVFLDIIVVAVTVAGAVVGIIGGALLPGTLYERDRYAERQALVRERIAAIRSGQAQEPYTPPEQATPQAALELRKREEQRPGLGLPIALMASGAPVALLGGFYWASEGSRSSTSGVPPIAIAIGLLTVGVAMEGLGIFFLISRLQQRAEIDAQIEQLQQRGVPETVPPPTPDDVPPPAPPPPPPSVQSMPPAPLFFAYGWSF